MKRLQIFILFSFLLFVACTPKFSYLGRESFRFEDKKIMVFLPVDGVPNASHPLFSIRVNGPHRSVSSYKFYRSVIYRSDWQKRIGNRPVVTTYTVAYGDDARIPFSLIDSFVFAKAVRVIDSLGIEMALSPSKAKGSTPCSP
jgi:hypothetical protein